MKPTSGALVPKRDARLAIMMEAPHGTVTCWPASESAKPVLVGHLEATLRQHISMIEGAMAQEGSAPHSVSSLRIAALLHCTTTLRKSFRDYADVFRIFELIVEGVAVDIDALYKKCREERNRADAVTHKLAASFTQNAQLKRSFDEAMTKRDKEVANLVEMKIKEPQLYEDEVRKLKHMLFDVNQELRGVKCRDADLSSTVVSKVLMINDLETKLFELQRQKQLLLEDAKRHIDEKKRVACQIEFIQIKHRKELDEKDSVIRNLRRELAEVSAARVEQLHAAEESHQQLSAQSNFDWSKIQRSTAEDMYQHDDDGQRTQHISELPEADRIKHFVSLYREAKKRITILEAEVARLAAEQMKSPEMMPSAIREEKFHPMAGFNVPPFLVWSKPGPVVGQSLSEGELMVQLRPFFTFHKQFVRENRWCSFDECFMAWLKSRHISHATRRIALAYSLLYSLSNVQNRNLEVLMFEALLNGDAPNTICIDRAEMMIDLRAHFEQKLSRAKLTSKIALECFLKRYFKWLEDGDVFIVAQEALRSLSTMENINVEKLFDESSTFVRCIARYHLFSVVDYLQSMRRAVRGIVPTVVTTASGASESIIHLQDAFSVLHELDPAKPMEVVESEVLRALHWDTSKNSEGKLHESQVDQERLVSCMGSVCLRRFSPRPVPTYVPPLPRFNIRLASMPSISPQPSDRGKRSPSRISLPRLSVSPSTISLKTPPQRGPLTSRPSTLQLSNM